jgi:hypothetical protein
MIKNTVKQERINKQQKAQSESKTLQNQRSTSEKHINKNAKQNLLANSSNSL